MPVATQTNGHEHDTTMTGRPYLVVSADSHAAPSLENQLRPYCPKQYLEQFDDFVRRFRGDPESIDALGRIADHSAPQRTEVVEAATRYARNCPGYHDPHARLQHMDEDGVAVDVIFSGGQGVDVLPFLAAGFDAGSAGTSVELRAVGSEIWNDWLADFVSVQPERHVGVMQIAINDVDRAVRTIERAHARGLKAVNLPAPRVDYPPYTEAIYEPLWSVCESLEIPMVTHTASGEASLGSDGSRALPMQMAEVDWLSRRGLWQLIFGGVFERHPGLKLVFTEQRVSWVTDTLRNLDSIFYNDIVNIAGQVLPKPPSEYWKTNCFVGASFMAAYEAEMLFDVGLHNLMWGSDYPHLEGTWPRTRLAMRKTFADVPEEHARLILGENAIPVYGLDEKALRPVADRIGPRPEDLAKPLAEDEYPEVRGMAFRDLGAFA